MSKNHFAVAFICLLTGCTSLQKKDANGAKTEPPKLLKPVVRKIWIPPEIKDGGAEWIEGHYMYRIEKETSWSR